MFATKTLLITGGTGSFGNTVFERFLDTDISEIRVFAGMKKNRMTCSGTLQPENEILHWRCTRF